MPFSFSSGNGCFSLLTVPPHPAPTSMIKENIGREGQGRSYCFFYLILPAFLDTGLPSGNGHKWDSGPMRGATRKGWPHHRGVRPPLFSNSGVGSFMCHKNRSVKVLWDGTYGFSSLPLKTRKSNCLQMPLQRQHFLLSYLETLTVGLVRVWTHDLLLGRPALSQLS